MEKNKKVIDLFYGKKKKIAILIDPDKYQDFKLLERVLSYCKNGIDFIFVGGSLIIESNFKKTVDFIKKNSSLPLILFPGSPTQVYSEVDAVLFLSLISGRNAESLIGHHVVAAPLIKAQGIEPLPTGYMLIDGGVPTTASYISNTFPIPRDKPEISSCTALAGEMLGLRLIYLDCGSGAKNPVPELHISSVRKTTTLPIIVGGGISSIEMVSKAFSAGADVVVIGNRIESNPEFVKDLAKEIPNFKLKSL